MPEDRLSKVAQWAPVAAVRSGLAGTTLGDHALALLSFHLAIASLDTYGLSSTNSESDRGRRNKSRTNGVLESNSRLPMAIAPTCYLWRHTRNPLTRAGHVWLRAALVKVLSSAQELARVNIYSTTSRRLKRTTNMSRNISQQQWLLWAHS